jgi:hypothetical protein
VTLLLLMNLGFAGSGVAPAAFKAFWLSTLNAQIGPTPQQPSPL